MLEEYVQDNIYARLDTHSYLFFVCFVALHPKSTAKVIAGQSVHFPTLFPGQLSLNKQPVLSAHTCACN